MTDPLLLAVAEKDFGGPLICVASKVETVESKLELKVVLLTVDPES